MLTSGAQREHQQKHKTAEQKTHTATKVQRTLPMCSRRTQRLASRVRTWALFSLPRTDSATAVRMRFNDSNMSLVPRRHALLLDATDATVSSEGLQARCQQNRTMQQEGKQAHGAPRWQGLQRCLVQPVPTAQDHTARPAQRRGLARCCARAQRTRRTQQHADQRTQQRVDAGRTCS